MLDNQTSPEKLDFKRVLPIIMIVFVDFLGLTIIIPLMTLYAAKFNTDAFTIGVLGAMYPIFQFIGAPFLGRLSDRFGRKPILMISQLGTFFGFILLGMANALWILFLARIIDGLSGANISTAQAAISDSTTEKTRTQGLGLLGASFGIGFIIGPIISFVSLSLSNNNYSIPAFIAAGFSALSIILTWLLFKETLDSDNPIKGYRKAPFSLSAMTQALRHPNVGIILAIVFLQQIAFGGLQQFLSLFNLNRLGLSASGNSIIFTLVGIIIVIIQGGMIGRWSRRFGERKLIYFGLALLSIGLILISLTPHVPVPGYSKARVSAELQGKGNIRSIEHPTTKNITIELPDDDHNGYLGIIWILAAMLPTTIGGSVLHPSLNSLITKRVERNEVGGMLGISAAFLSAANAIAPMTMGTLFQFAGSTAPYMFGGILTLALLFLAIVKIKPGKEEPAR